MRSDFRPYGIEIVPDGFTARVKCACGISIYYAIKDVCRIARSGVFGFHKYVIRHDDEIITITDGTSERRAAGYWRRKVCGISADQDRRIRAAEA